MKRLLTCLTLASLVLSGYCHAADAKAEQDYQKSELERSLKYCKETLGLGTR